MTDENEVSCLAITVILKNGLKLDARKENGKSRCVLSGTPTSRSWDTFYIDILAEQKKLRAFLVERLHIPDDPKVKLCEGFGVVFDSGKTLLIIDGLSFNLDIESVCEALYEFFKQMDVRR